MTKSKVIDKKPSKNGNLSQKPLFLTPGGFKRGENEFSGKKRKRHVLTFPKTKLHAKKSETSIARFSRKPGGRTTERERQRETERDRDGPKFKGPPDAKRN